MRLDAYDRLMPEITDGNAEYFDGLEEHELRLQICDHDGSYRFPPSPVCPLCLSPDTSWKAVSGRATLWSWIVMHQRYFDAFEDERPYVVAFVKLEEGPVMVSGILDAAREELSVDAPLELGFEQIGTHTVPKFRLAK